jgi:hypothetical protein
VSPTDTDTAVLRELEAVGPGLLRRRTLLMFDSALLAAAQTVLVASTDGDTRVVLMATQIMMCLAAYVLGGDVHTRDWTQRNARAKRRAAAPDAQFALLTPGPMSRIRVWLAGVSAVVAGGLHLVAAVSTDGNVRLFTVLSVPLALLFMHAGTQDGELTRDWRKS